MTRAAAPLRSEFTQVNQFMYFFVALPINNPVVVHSLRNMASETRLGCKASFDWSLLGRGPLESCEPSCPQPPLFTRNCAGSCFGSVPTKHPAGPHREDRTLSVYLENQDNAVIQGGTRYSKVESESERM